MNASQKLLNKAADAVFNIDSDELQHILSIAYLSTSDVQSLGVIVQCWKIVLEHIRRIWSRKENRYLVRRISDNKQVHDLLETLYSMKLAPVDFTPLVKQTSGLDKDKVYKSSFGETNRELHDDGYWESDLKMYLAVDRFNLHRVESLLRAGANPRVDVPFMNDNCYNILDSESMVLIIRLQPVIGGLKHMKCTDENFMFLYYLAGLFKMRDLMERYDPEG